jgi:hypothetical protein
VVTAAADILAQAEKRGCHFTIDGGRLRATPKVGDRALYDAIGVHKDAIVALLREREGRCATDAVLFAQALLRQGRFSPETPRCALHCGETQERCKRCGAPFDDHCTALP